MAKIQLEELEIAVKRTAGERQFILYRYFLENTRKGHAVSRKDIFDYLATYNIFISPHTLYNDFDILRSTMGLDIEFDPHVKNQGMGGYWVKNPPFEPKELLLMVDSVQASKFITQKEADTITSKIKDLADIHTRASLNRTAYVRGRGMNENSMKNATKIYQAIGQEKKISFQYFHYAPDKSKKYSNNGNRLIVSPYALHWENGNYYLYAFSDGEFRSFRIDRMERISEPLPLLRDGAEQYRKTALTSTKQAKVFSMYHGETYKVKLRCINYLAGAVIDEFGKDVMLIPDGDNHFTFLADVEVSPPFYAWVATFGRRAKILGPEPVVEGMKEFLQKSLEMYKDDGEK